MHHVHPMRETLHNEVHARPYERMTAPLLLTHVAMVGGEAGAAREHLSGFLRARHLPVPAADAGHLSIDIGGLQLRWEQHTEFAMNILARDLRHASTAFVVEHDIHFGLIV